MKFAQKIINSRTILNFKYLLCNVNTFEAFNPAISGPIWGPAPTYYINPITCQQGIVSHEGPPDMRTESIQPAHIDPPGVCIKVSSSIEDFRTGSKCGFNSSSVWHWKVHQSLAQILVGTLSPANCRQKPPKSLAGNWKTRSRDKRRHPEQQLFKSIFAIHRLWLNKSV